MKRVGATIAAAGALFGIPALAAPLVEGQDAFMARCRAETLAAYPSARAQVGAICGSKWDQVVAAGPLADTVIDVAPPRGTAFDARAARTRAQALRGFVVSQAAAPAQGLALSWSRPGEPIPFELEDALRARGVKLAMIGCQSYGVAEGMRVYSAEAPGKAPFALTVAFRSAALASQSSSHVTTLDFSPRRPTLASLRSDGSEWAPTCPN